MTYKYAILDENLNVVRTLSTDTPIPSSEIGKNSNGKDLVLPYIEYQFPLDYDNELYSASSPTYIVQDKQVLQNYTITPNPNVEKILLDRIDLKADEFRKIYITDSPTMAMVYMWKEAEAKDYINGGYTLSTPPEAGSYPLLESTVGIDADTLDQVAMVVLTEANKFKRLAASIETTRLRIKTAIKSASAIGDKKAAYDLADWDIDFSVMKDV